MLVARTVVGKGRTIRRLSSNTWKTQSATWRTTRCSWFVPEEQMQVSMRLARWPILKPQQFVIVEPVIRLKLPFTGGYQVKVGGPG